MRYEQTFNVINFNNKLQGLENKPDYPKEKPWYFRPDKDTNANYNILSNVALADHHYDAPSKRPPADEEIVLYLIHSGYSLNKIDIIRNKN